jgi:hypothetical protein
VESLRHPVHDLSAQSGQPIHISGWSLSRDGRDMRYFYNDPSHTTWVDDDTVLEGRFFSLYNDDGSAKIAEKLADTGGNNITPTVLPKPYDDWILGDSYEIEGVQHLLLFHGPAASSFHWRN